MSTNWESTIEQLDTARSQWWLYSLLCGLLLAVSLALLALVIVVTTDVAVGLSLGIRVGIFWAWCIVSLGLICAAIFRAFRYQRTRYAAARRIETALRPPTTMGGPPGRTGFGSIFTGPKS